MPPDVGASPFYASVDIRAMGATRDKIPFEFLRAVNGSIRQRVNGEGQVISYQGLGNEVFSE